ncbi:MAG TPA: TolC family protein [Puia sp.]|nr:TolC family protein [Puia sp.]
MRIFLFLPICLLLMLRSMAQTGDSVLTLAEALRKTEANYPGIKAAQHLVSASAHEWKAARQDGLPDFTAGVEAAYGTIDGMNGLPAGEPGINAITSGPVTATQNWNAAFGALYLTNVDWNLFSFGLQRAHVAAAKGQYEQDRQGLAQQIFQQQVLVAGAYLSLLAAQRVRMAMEDNLARTLQLREVILARTLNGLNPGVDSSLADAEVSKARLSLLDARNYEQKQASQLAIKMGVRPQLFQLDTSSTFRLPQDLSGGVAADLASNPNLRYLESQVMTSSLLANYIQKTGLPRVSLFGVGQERGSGFGPNYGTNPADYSTAFFPGIAPNRANYLVGIGVTWDITMLGRSRSRTGAQRERSSAYTEVYQLEQNNLVNQLALADEQIRNALAKFRETPIQLKSASDAYRQKEALYENGLANIVDVSQALYLLNRAEIDRGIASNAVWQAFLLRVGTIGDLHPFLQQF